MNSAPLSISVRAISDIVCNMRGLPRAQLITYRRHAAATEARQIIAWIAFNLTGKSYAEIGRVLGRDHTTIMASVRVVEDRCVVNEAFAAELDRIVTVCRSHAESFEHGSLPLPSDIDAAAVARRILETPRGAVRVSVIEIEAMAAEIITARALRNAVIRTLTADDTTAARIALDDMIEHVVTGPEEPEQTQEATHG